MAGTVSIATQAGQLARTLTDLVPEPGIPLRQERGQIAATLRQTGALMRNHTSGDDGIRQIMRGVENLAERNRRIIDGTVPHRGYDRYPDYADLGSIITDLEILEALDPEVARQAKTTALARRAWQEVRTRPWDVGTVAGGAAASVGLGAWILPQATADEPSMRPFDTMTLSLPLLAVGGMGVHTFLRGRASGAALSAGIGSVVMTGLFSGMYTVLTLNERARAEAAVLENELNDMLDD